jgi:hypothetical protein
MAGSYGLKRCRACFGDLLVLVHGAGADPMAPTISPSRRRGYPREDDDAPSVRVAEAEELLAGLCQGARSFVSVWKAIAV